MKIALPTRNGKIDDHFGHCEMYTVISLSENKKIESTEILNTPKGCGCKSEIAEELSKMGVTVMLAGNMGMNAVQKITCAGIEVYRGCSGEINDVVEAFLKNELTDSGVACDQHQRQHQHRQDCQH